MNIYVGNLPNSVNEGDLREVFQAFGEVSTAAVIKDKFSGESRGFGFVEMPKKEEADKAISMTERQGPERPHGQGQRSQTAHGLLEVRRFRQRPELLRSPPGEPGDRYGSTKGSGWFSRSLFFVIGTDDGDVGILSQVLASRSREAVRPTAEELNGPSA